MNKKTTTLLKNGQPTTVDTTEILIDADSLKYELEKLTKKYEDLLNVVYNKSIPVHRIGKVVGYFVHCKELQKLK